ncbi:DUF4834 family protein [bacterium SCSIO 12741]|nr:DUF4834 family protein [bacterium SCSIO 12741]
MLLAVTNAITTILILLLTFYGFRFLFRYLTPIVLRMVAKRVEKKMREQAQNGPSPSNRGERVNNTRDEVYVKRPADKKKKSGDDFPGGEYIDFEEVE